MYTNFQLRNIMMDHLDHPRNKSLENTEEYTKVTVGRNDCDDEYTIAANIQDGTIQDVVYDGKGCAISLSSVSIMSELVKGKTKQEVEVMIKEFNKMMKHEAYDEDILKEAVAFCNTYRQPSRIKCATLAWQGIEQLIDKDQNDE